MATHNNGPELLSGQKWRATHQSSVDAILGAGVRSVRSEGDRFYNTDNWVSRSFGAALCEWAELNPQLTPTRNDIAGWVTKANQMSVRTREIVIAATPDELPRGVAHALVGGAYHESWHTLYSRTRSLHLDEVVQQVQDLWDMIPCEPSKGMHGWKGLTGAVLQWANLIEDIIIERNGCKEFPGAQEKMEALQDLILSQEREGRQASDPAKATSSILQVISGTFRDLGLGYDTADQKLALLEYQEKDKSAYEFVTLGPLRPFLDKAIEAEPGNGLTSLWMAMSIVATLCKSAEARSVPPPTPQPSKSPQGKPQPGEGQGQPSEGGEGQGQHVWKVGDRAKLKTGPYAGRTVEVTRAGLPGETTKLQHLEYALVEEA